MGKFAKKALTALTALSMAASSLVMPLSANADTVTPLVDGDTVIKEWKFDFGTADKAADGYTVVTPDRNYMTNQDYGFLGIDENAYKLSERLDAFGMQEGQVIKLQAGGLDSDINDGIGSVGEDIYGNAGDEYYPTRFALKVEDEQYFRVKATVTTLDPEKDAEISVYTERKHPIITNETVKAGETKTVEFSVRTTPIYYQKSEPQGTIADGMVNVAVLGENSALASLEIQQVETLPTFWVLGDSTVTDGNCALPFFKQQNYTGVGTGLTKYLPRTMAMVNEGEGGLNATDNMHYNVVASRIKAGDYLYVEYGHNHKDNGTAEYVSNLDKYYNKAHEVGAKLIIVSPIERINTISGGKYQYTLRGFAEAGEKYVADKVSAGATDIAYVDLNKYSLDLYNTIVEENGNDTVAIQYYFRAAKGGSVDITHPNDAGAENIAYEFMNAAKAVTDDTQKAVVNGFLADMTAETPNRVPAEIMTGVGGSAWPTYVPPVTNEYPVEIKDIEVGEDGSVASATVKVQQAKINLSSYGIIVITVYNEDGSEKGKIYAVDQVDNSTGYGTQVIENFTKDVTIGENDTYTAVVLPALDTDSGLKVNEDSDVIYSATFKPTGIVEYILPGEDTDVETFEYYGQETLEGSGDYVFGGSSGSVLTLGTDNKVPYSTIGSTGSGNSWYVMRPLENLDAGTGSTGRYMISVDLKYESGSGLTFALAESTTPNKSPFVTNQFDFFTVGNGGTITVNDTEVGTISADEWSNVKCILDMSAGTIETSVSGGTPVVVDAPMYQTFSAPTYSSLKHFVLSGARTTAFSVKASNMTVAKLKDNTTKTTLNVSVDTESDGMGSVYTTEAGAASQTVAQAQTATATAVANKGYVFTGWKSNEKMFSEDATLSLRLYKDLDLVASFAKQSGIDGVTSYAVTADKGLVKAGGATVKLSLADVADKAGNPVVAENTDAVWSCDENGVTVDANGVVTIGSDFAIGENTTKDVTVKAVLNNIEKTCTITVYSYAFYENAAGGKTSAGWDGDVTAYANNNCIVFPGGGNTSTLTLPEAVSLTSQLKLSYIAAGGGSQSKFCGQPRYIEIYDTNGKKVVNEVIGYSWSGLTVGGTIGKDSISDGTAFADAVVMGKWSNPVTITINTDGTGTVTFGSSSADITINTDAEDIAQIKFISKAGAPTYDARGLGITNIAVEKEKVKGINLPSTKADLEKKVERLVNKLVNVNVKDRATATTMFLTYLETDKGIETLKTAINDNNTADSVVGVMGDYSEYTDEIILALDMIKAVPADKREAVAGEAKDKTALTMTDEQKASAEKLYTEFVNETAANEFKTSHNVDSAVVANALKVFAGSVIFTDDGSELAVKSVSDTFNTNLAAAINGKVIDGKTFKSGEAFVEYITEKMNTILGKDLIADVKAVFAAAGIYEEYAEPKEDIEVNEPTKDDNEVKVVITNNKDKDQTAQLIVVSFGKDKSIDSIKLSDKATIAAGETKTLTAPVPTTDDYKVMVWNSVEAMTPLADAVVEIK